MIHGLAHIFVVSYHLNVPTLEVASVKLFSVVDFPLDGYAPHTVSGVLVEDK